MSAGAAGCDAAPPVVRPPVAVLVSRFPRLTETFVLRELIELERQGQPVRLVPLLREREAVVHGEAEAWVDRAFYTPFISAALLGANLRALRRAPRLYLGLLARLLARSIASPNLGVRTLALWPKSVYLAQCLRAEGVVHVHAHFATHPTTAALVACELGGLPFSFTVHAHDIFVRRALLDEKLRRARFVRAISRFNRAFLLQHHPGIDAASITVIHTGVDPSRYARERAGPLTPRLVCVAALRPYKGLAVLVEACRRLRREGVLFTCDLVGDGPLRAPLERQVAAAGLSGYVRLLGARCQDEVRRLLAGATIAVHPSVVAPDGQMDGIPVALMEAMAAGLPVVASSLSGIPELVEHEVDGLLVPPDDAAALTDALRRLIADPFLCRRLGDAARGKVAAEFDLAACVAQLRERMAAESLPADERCRVAVSHAAFTELAGRRVGLRRRHSSRESLVAELLVGDGEAPRELVLKEHQAFRGESCPPEERARREYQALRGLERGLGGPAGTRYGAPRALGLDGARVLMQPCAGVPLVDLLRARRGARPADPALFSALWHSGRWLRLFEGCTPSAVDPHPALDALLAQARLDLEACAAGGRLSRSQARRLGPRLERLRARVPPEALCLVRHHGDFWPGNVFVASTSVEVIDFEGLRDGLAGEDAAYFVAQLTPFVAYPGLGRAGRALRAAFLAGYFGDDTPNADLWALCRLSKALQVLRAEREGGPLRRSWRRAVLRGLLREGA